MQDKRPRLVITGAAGVIGGVLWQGLGETSEIWGVDLEADRDRVIAADVSKPDAALEAFEEIGGFGLLIHLAADRRVEAHWSSVRINNIEATYQVYAAAHAHGVRRIVFASSNHVSGMAELKRQPGQMIYPEDPPRPDSLYGVSKLFGEGLARYYYEQHGIESVCLRIGTVLEDDDPTHSSRYMRTWLSHNDLVRLVRASLRAEVGFGVYYGVSDNEGRYWSLESARRDLGFEPQDDASQLARRDEQ